jgi:beta-galactosidase
MPKFFNPAAWRKIVWPITRRKLWLAAALLVIGAAGLNAAEPVAPFDSQWRFIRSDPSKAQMPGFNDQAWEMVTLPHTAHVEALVTGAGDRQWQGVCWYRKNFLLPADARDREIFLRFDGAMNAAEIWVNGQSAGKFMGGYLPYVMDISKFARPGRANVVAVRLDNRDNPITGPKPLADLDFNLYGGLYRDARLVIKNKLHITDPIPAYQVAGGGVFVTFPVVTKTQAVVRVETQVQNQDGAARTFTLRTTVLDARGKVVSSAESAVAKFPAGAERKMTQDITVTNPALWSPQSPRLYQVRSELVEKGKVMDAEQTRIGIRRIEMTADGFRINGEKMFLAGANRHQEYPYIGNALSDDAQYRDALKIKQAGFDYIRLSHYPQSPAFLDACDELGLVVMDSILGWQYFNRDPAFAVQKLKECRELVRRDRNHPCVILWEVSLNESDMPPSFIAAANAAAHEEYPGDQCYTAGWERGYDVFMQARQHGGCRGITNRPCLISEYGDWEYYAQNAGFEQNRWQDLKPAERSSRQLRGDGEMRLLQQEMNFQEAHNDDLKTTAFADGVWVMFDYNRGYAPDLESSGVMDIFRLPKFSYWFFRSQRDAGELIAGQPLGPVIYVANYWTADSPLAVRVFSNCEEVALYLNDRLLEQRRPDVSRASTNLRHPPFTFDVTRFEPGTLRAVGYIGGHEVTQTERRTPGDVNGLALQFDLSGRPFAANGKDVVFCYANLKDAAGTPAREARVPVFFGSDGQVRLAGANPIYSEAGTAGILMTSDGAKPSGTVFALCLAGEGEGTRILSAAASPGGSKIPNYKIHYTTDGTEPSMSSPVYAGPVTNAAQLRAAIFVKNQAVAVADVHSRAASTSGEALPASEASAKP